MKTLKFALLIVGIVTLNRAVASPYPAPLNRVLALAQQTRSQGMLPTVVMDLDETVLDSIPRWAMAYRETARSLCGQAVTRDCMGIRSLNFQDFYQLKNRYDHMTLANQKQINPQSAFFKAFDLQALGLYLSGQYLEWDAPLPGALAFIQHLKRLGVRPFFVTSRLQSKQGPKTLQSLIELGILAPGEESFLMLRPDGMSSIDFKVRSFQQIRTWAHQNRGSIVGVFENEPENINAMVDTFPEAAAIFVEGAYQKYEKLHPKIMLISSY